MFSVKLASLLLLLFLVGTQQSCPQLCTTSCSNSTCSSCYSSFLSNANISSTCTQCPATMFLNTTTRLCMLCPITCNTCTNYSICTTCITGFMLSNQYACIPNITLYNGWTNKNVSYDLFGSAPWASGIVIYPNASSLINFTNNQNVSNYSFSCSKMPFYNWFGGINTLNPFSYNFLLVKHLYSLPPHQWINIRFQAILIDNWLNNTLLLELDSL